MHPATPNARPSTASRQPKSKEGLSPFRLKSLIWKDVQGVQEAIHGEKLDQAFFQTTRVLDVASHAVDRDQVGWMVISTANALVNNKSFDLAEQLYQRAFVVLNGWSND